MWSTFFTVGFGCGFCPVAAQISSYDHLETARAHFRAGRLDSAVVHLRASLDASGHPRPDDQVQAWLLLGVIAFYKGDDSGTSVDFRHALALDPLLTGDGLARYDSALVVLFNAARSSAVADTGSPGEAVVDCTRTCPEDVVLPRMLSFPALEGIPPDRFEALHGRFGMMTVQFIVDTAGWVAPASLLVVTGDMQMKELERALLGALAKTRFTPAQRAKGRRVPVLVFGKLGFRSGHFTADVPVAPRRRSGG